MSTVDPEASLAALVLDQPQRAELFERLGFDYCCGGARSLAATCADRDLDVETVVRILEAHTPATESRSGHDYDCRSATSLGELCEHVVEAHHELLRRELPRLAEQLATVVRVHGADDPRLRRLQEVFAALEPTLLAHLDREEQRLFPACRILDQGGEPSNRLALLDELEHDHADVGETLRLLRELAGDYDPTSARCGTHRALLDGLNALERDLHLHVHEENNVLFPRIRGRLAA